MSTIPSGPLWCAYLLEITLADVQAWRDIVGAADREEARAYIYYPWMVNDNQNETPVAGPGSGVPPRAIISGDADVVPFARRQYSPASFRGEASLLLSFDLPIPEATYDQGPKEAGYYFDTLVGGIMQGLEKFSGGRGEAIAPGEIAECPHGFSYFDMKEYDKFDGPFEIDPAEDSVDWLTEAGLPRHVYHMAFTLMY